MSDQLTTLLRERLAGHEMDVPPSAWEHVSGHLAASASGASLQETLRGKFSGHEVEVDPSAWANISGQLGTGAATGTSFSTGWIAAGVAAVAITATLLLWNGKDETRTVIPEPSPATATTAMPVKQAPNAVAEVPAPMPPVAPLEQPAKSGTEQRAGTGQHVAPPEQAQKQAVAAAAPNPPKQKKEPMAMPEATAPVKAAHATENAPPNAAPNLPASPAATTAPKPEPAHQPGPQAAPQQRPALHDNRTEEAPAGEVTEHDPLVLGSATTDAATDLLIPTAFSPNGDGTNDKWKVVTTEEATVEIRVYSLSGALVFEANDLRQAWDGRLPNGALAEEGNYTCLVKLFKPNGQAQIRTGQIHLFR